MTAQLNCTGLQRHLLAALLITAAAAAKSLQSCPILYDPMDCSPPGSSDHGIVEARIVERVPFPSLGALSDPGIEPASPALQVDSLPSEPPGTPPKQN